jgi:hypothetical protein
MAVALSGFAICALPEIARNKQDQSFPVTFARRCRTENFTRGEIFALASTSPRRAFFQLMCSKAEVYDFWPNVCTCQVAQYLQEAIHHAILRKERMPRDYYLRHDC